ncbi:hypothetical protein Tco_0438328 [Tanacetum coccineum]
MVVVANLVEKVVEDEEVATVDGVFEGAFRALGDNTGRFGNGHFSNAMEVLWRMIMDEEVIRYSTTFEREFIRRKSYEMGKEFELSATGMLDGGLHGIHVAADVAYGNYAKPGIAKLKLES